MNLDFNLKFLSFNRRITLSKQGVQYGIGILTMLMATIASYWGSMRVFLLLLIAFAVLVTTLVLMRHIAIGYLLLLIGGIFVPFSGPGGINATMIILVFMVFLWMMDRFVVRRRFEFVRSGPIRPAVYFMVVSVAAFGMGQIFWYVTAIPAPLDAQLGGFAIYFFSLAAMVMTANVLKDVRWLKAFVWLFIGLGAIYVLGRVINLPAITGNYVQGYTANSMFWTWIVALSLGQVLFNQDLSRHGRLVLFMIVAVTLYVAVIQTYDWKSGWVPPLVVVGVLLALRFKKLAVAAIPFALIAVIYFAQDLITSDQYSWDTRLDAWRIVLEVSRVNPVLGLGFANYYWYVTLFNIRGYYIEFSSHNQYVDLIAQTGIAGLICFLWILFEVGRLGWSLLPRVKDGFARGYAYGVFAGLAGVVVAAFLVDWVLPFAYNIGLTGFRASILPWIFFGGLISIEQIYIAKTTS